MKTSALPFKSFLNYFAYGANLHRKQMRRRCPRSRPVASAFLKGHALRISLPQGAPAGPGWATVTPDPDAIVPGALYRLHADDLPALDDYEDYPEIYLREEMAIESDGNSITAMIYRMKEPIRPAPPTPEYAQVLRTGYRDFNLDSSILEAALQEAQRQNR